MQLLPNTSHQNEATLPLESEGAASERAALDAFEPLHRGEIDLVSWRRTLPSGLDEHLDAWLSSEPARFDQIISSSDDDLSITTRGVAEPARAWLTRDVVRLVACFARFVDARKLRVAFGPVRTDQCRKFHVDFVSYRLVTTYVGPGTEWVPDDAVRREALEDPPACPHEANRAILRDASAVRRAEPGEVIVMKGALRSSLGGAVHRSPPIERVGRPRVVLIVTTVDKR